MDLRRITLLLIAGTASIAGQCNPQDRDRLVAVGEAIRDDDDDGWFTNATNQRIILTLDSASLPAPGSFHFLVDDVRFPLAPGLNGKIDVSPLQVGVPLAVGAPVARRAVGVSVLQAANGALTFTVPVRVNGPFVTNGSANVTFSNTPGTFTATVGNVTLAFSTAVQRFADPTPNSDTGDTDADGLTEREEAILSEGLAGLGDPTQPDALLVVAWSHPDFALVPATREVMKTRFRFRGINLLIDDGAINGRPGSGGLVGGVGRNDSTVNQAAVTAIRNARITIRARRRMSYFALLHGKFTSSTGATTFWGEGSGIPGNQLVMQSRPFFPLAADVGDYQSGVLMHEFGHLLGLCHPTDAPPPCAALPAAEANPSATIMGTPAETPPLVVGPFILPNLPVQAVQALARPRDYTATQWARLGLGAGLAP